MYVFILLINSIIVLGQNNTQVNIANRIPGSLGNVLSEYDITKIEELAVSGPINTRDYILILFKMKELRKLDLSKATIVACKFENPYIASLPPQYYKGRPNTLTFGFRIFERQSAGTEQPAPRKLEEVILPDNL